MLTQYLYSNHTKACPTVFHTPKLALIFDYMAFIKTAMCCLATIQYDHSASCTCKWYLDTNFCPFVVYSYEGTKVSILCDYSCLVNY